MSSPVHSHHHLHALWLSRLQGSTHQGSDWTQRDQRAAQSCQFDARFLPQEICCSGWRCQLRARSQKISPACCGAETGAVCRRICQTIEALHAHSLQTEAVRAASYSAVRYHITPSSMCNHGHWRHSLAGSKRSAAWRVVDSRLCKSQPLHVLLMCPLITISALWIRFESADPEDFLKHDLTSL